MVQTVQRHEKSMIGNVNYMVRKVKSVVREFMVRKLYGTK